MKKVIKKISYFGVVVIVVGVILMFIAVIVAIWVGIPDVLSRLSASVMLGGISVLTICKFIEAINDTYGS